MGKLLFNLVKNITLGGIDLAIYILEDKNKKNNAQAESFDQDQTTKPNIELSLYQQQQISGTHQNVDNQSYRKIIENQPNSNQYIMNKEKQVDQSGQREQVVQQNKEIEEQQFQEQEENQINQNQNSSNTEENQNIQAVKEESSIVSLQTEINTQPSENVIKDDEQNKQQVEANTNNSVKVIQSKSSELNEESQQVQQELKEEHNQIISQLSDTLEVILQKLNAIFNNSYKARAVDINLQNFVSMPLNQDELLNYYFPSKKIQFKKEIKEIKKELSGYRRIRGDGNCFYTAFVYQYFNILLNDEQKKQLFIQKVSTLSVKIVYQDIQIENNKIITKLFLEEFDQIKNEQDLFEKISNPEEIFYGLSIIVMRNYIADIYINDNELKSLGNEQVLPDLLEWEKECNSNELIISGLSKQLNLQIIVHFFDMKNSLYKKTVYGENQELPKVILLLAPGHYQIGLQNE